MGVQSAKIWVNSSTQLCTDCVNFLTSHLTRTFSSPFKKIYLPQKVDARIESRNIQNSKCTVDIMYVVVVSFLFLSSAHITTKQKYVCWNPVRKIEWVSSAYLIKRNSGLKGGDNSCQDSCVYFEGSGFLLPIW